MTETREVGLSAWGRRIVYGYAFMLLISVLLGLVAGRMINEGGTLAGDPIAVVSWFVLFPVYLLADGIINTRFLTCPVRIASLPLVEGFVIWQVTDWGDPFGVSQVVAIIYAVVSVIVVAVTSIVRRRRLGDVTDAFKKTS